MGELSRLKGLGSKSERCLNQIGVHTRAELARLGPVSAFLRLERAGLKPSLNFLYALAGALENRPWTEIAKFERERLLLELEAQREWERGEP